MATFQFKMSPGFEQAMYRLGDLYDNVAPKMLKAGQAVLYEKLRPTKFGKYYKLKSPKKNRMGWFAQIQINGKTETGAPAALAATVYEYGRQGYHPQPARPEIRQVVNAAEAETVRAMEEVLKEEIRKL